MATNCSQLKLQFADGKVYMQDALNTKGILRLIQSIPSKKAEPFLICKGTKKHPTNHRMFIIYVMAEQERLELSHQLPDLRP